MKTGQWSLVMMMLSLIIAKMPNEKFSMMWTLIGIFDGLIGLALIFISKGKD
jgi:hypothetical protein